MEKPDYSMLFAFERSFEAFGILLEETSRSLQDTVEQTRAQLRDSVSLHALDRLEDATKRLEKIGWSVIQEAKTAQCKTHIDMEQKTQETSETKR